MKKTHEDKLMVYVVILLLLTVGILYAKSNTTYKKTDLKEALAAGFSNGECYTNWDGIECAEGYTAVKNGKLTVVTDPSVASCECGYEYEYTYQTGYGDETINGTGSGICVCEINIGAGDKICASIPDRTAIATWGLVVEQSNFDCVICCKI